MDMKEAAPEAATPQNVHRRAEKHAPSFWAQSMFLRFRLCISRALLPEETEDL